MVHGLGCLSTQGELIAIRVISILHMRGTPCPCLVWHALSFEGRGGRVQEPRPDQGVPHGLEAPLSVVCLGRSYGLSWLTDVRRLRVGCVDASACSSLVAGAAWHVGNVPHVKRALRRAWGTGAKTTPLSGRATRAQDRGVR